MRHTPPLCDVTPKNGILISLKAAEHYYDQFPQTFAKYGLLCGSSWDLQITKDVSGPQDGGGAWAARRQRGQGQQN